MKPGEITHSNIKDALDEFQVNDKDYLPNDPENEYHKAAQEKSNKIRPQARQAILAINERHGEGATSNNRVEDTGVVVLEHRDDDIGKYSIVGILCMGREDSGEAFPNPARGHVSVRLGFAMDEAPQGYDPVAKSPAWCGYQETVNGNRQFVDWIKFQDISSYDVQILRDEIEPPMHTTITEYKAIKALESLDSLAESIDIIQEAAFDSKLNPGRHTNNPSII